MPVLRRQIELSNSNQESFKDNEEIFYCESTKEMFRSYEEYFKRIMLINSMVWTCELTGRSDLTYNEALQSEKISRKLVKPFPLKIPALLLANQLKCTSWKDLLDEIVNYLKQRFCMGEIVSLIESKGHKPKSAHYKVVDIFNDKPNEDDEKFYRYKIVPENSSEPDKSNGILFKIVTGSELYRRIVGHTSFNRDRLKMFLRQFIYQKGILLQVKEDLFKKYVDEDHNVLWRKQFPCKLPEFESSKRVQDLQNNKKERKPKVELEKERQKSIVAMTFQIARELNRTNQEDLQLRDVRPLPKFKPVTTLLPMEYFGNFVTILEFMHSFSDLLTIKDKFQDGITMDILERAFLLREFNGPLNDILQVLLSSIFYLQLEEEEYCDIIYTSFYERNIKNLQISENEKNTLFAAKAAKYPSKCFGSNLTDCPMDYFTINELIRLHFLSSGATVAATTARWRFQNRGGYHSFDDPGFEFCSKYPHIIKFLEKSTVFDLPFDDLINIILCLINQIQTYWSVRNEIEERLEQSSTAKIDLKTCYSKQRRFKVEMTASTAELQAEHTKELENLLAQQPPPANIDSIKLDLETKLEKNIQKIRKPLKDLEKEFAKCKQSLFAFQMLLGQDRAYRNYWLFESLPAIFIEHCIPSRNCLKSKPDFLPGLADCAPENRNKFIKNYVIENFFNNNELNKENINGESASANSVISTSTDNDVSNGIGSLYMCTTNEADCPVHTVDHPTYIQWSYINTEEELNNLIKSLNPLGTRERQLKECLELQKDLILGHIVNCPVEKFSVDPSEKDLIVNKMIKKFKRYSTNWTDENPNLILELATRENIFDLYNKVITGHLGNFKIKDTFKWGENLMNGNYSEMDFKNLDIDVLKARDYNDPGDYLNDIISKQDVKLNDQYTNNNNNDESVKKLGLALIQIQKGIDKKFLKAPFGGEDSVICDRLTLNWQAGLLYCRNYSQIMLHYNVMYDAIKWSKSIERAYCRICRRQNEPDKMLLCDDCNGGYHMHCLKPKIKTIPEGDWFCVKCKPKLSKKKQKETTKFSVDEDFDETINDVSVVDVEDVTYIGDNDSEEETFTEEESSSELTDGKLEETNENSTKPCQLCKIDFDDDDEFKLVECEKCTFVCHLECAIPPLKHKPRHWICWRCNKKQKKTKQKKKPKTKKKIGKKNVDVIVPKKIGRNRKSPIEEDDEMERNNKARRRKLNTIESDDDGTPKAKQSKKMIDTEQLNGHQNSNTNRRSRQNDLPLHNVVLLELLDEISRHEDSWPFNRPVSKVDVPDYYEIIKIPMDFAKIKSRLNIGHYASDYEIMNDIQQIFINCDLYNNSASEIYFAGIRLEKFVQLKCKELHLPFRPSDMIDD